MFTCLCLGYGMDCSPCVGDPFKYFFPKRFWVMFKSSSSEKAEALEKKRSRLRRCVCPQQNKQPWHVGNNPFEARAYDSDQKNDDCRDISARLPD